MQLSGEDHEEGFVVWMTGLPASGKSTLSRLLEKELSERHGRRVEVLDGDEVRKGCRGTSVARRRTGRSTPGGCRTWRRCWPGTASLP